MTKPNEPILTCSEVVERLTRCVQEVPASQFIVEATKILDSWRERRVQELEELLAKHSGCSRCNDSASSSTSEESSTEIRRSK